MNPEQTRRSFLQPSAAAGLTVVLPGMVATGPRVMDQRRIPGTDEEIQVIGLGTSDEFASVRLRTARKRIETFFARPLVRAAGNIYRQ